MKYKRKKNYHEGFFKCLSIEVENTISKQSNMKYTFSSASAVGWFPFSWLYNCRQNMSKAHEVFVCI